MHRPSQAETGLETLLRSIGAKPTTSADDSVYPKAAHPFNDDLHANVVFRSSDKVDFHVHALILTIASPIFAEAKFPTGCALANTEGRPSKPVVIVVKEDSTTLDCLFRLCYPVPDPAFEDLTSVRAVYEAAKKYGMSEAMALMRTELRSFIPQAPLQVWAISCILELEEDAHAAADHMLELELDPFPPKTIPEYRELSAGVYFRLRRYLDRGVADADYVFRSLDEDEAALPTESPALLSESDIGIFPDYADLTCRSLDGQSYAAHKVVLAMSSPRLAERIRTAEGRVNCIKPRSETCSSSSSAPPPDRPDITFWCDGQMLARFLSLCYNSAPPWLRTASPEGLITLMDFSRKHLVSGVLEAASKKFRELSATRPLSCYLLAAKYAFHKEKALAEGFLHMDPMQYGYVREMRSVKAWIFHELVERRRNAHTREARRHSYA